MKRFIFWTLGILVSLVACIVVAGILLDTTERPVPETVAGFTETTLSVPHRDTDLPIFIWYPTDATTEPELIGQNGLFYGFHARRDAPAAAGAKPVVVFSHGSGGNAMTHGWIASALAEQGMIVIATNHPGTTSRDSTPEATVRLWERTQDLSAFIDFAQAGLPLGITADLDNVASMGFSLGGYTALAMAGAQASKQQFLDYCAEFPDKIDCGWMNAGGLDFDAIDQAKYEQSNLDPRITTVVAVDPALPRAVTEEGIAALTMPTLVVHLGDLETIFEGMRWDENAERIPEMSLSVISDTFHFAFMAECSALGNIIVGIAGDDNICSDEGTRARGDVHAEVESVIVPFLVDQLIASP